MMQGQKNIKLIIVTYIEVFKFKNSHFPPFTYQNLWCPLSNILCFK